MTLNDLKKQFEIINTEELDRYSNTEIAGKYLSSSSIMERNKYISYLICQSWNLLQKIYYTNNNGVLSEEDCYDIFMQTLHYVLNSHVWTNKKSTLYEDDKAFDKAMAITIQSRRKNFLKAKFRQKRIINSTNYSLDSLEENYTDGYFTSNEDHYLIDDIYEQIKDEILYYIRYNLYLTALILESIIYGDMYDDEGNFNHRKLKKHLKNLSPEFKEYFKKKYSISNKDFDNETDFSKLSFNEFEDKIKKSFTTLKYNDKIQMILDKYRKYKDK